MSRVEAAAILVCALWLAFACICRRLKGKFRGDVLADLAWGVSSVYARLMHRVRVEGRENLPPIPAPGTPIGPLVVVSNHTAGVDPVLIQTACPFEIRWMMMRAMMVPAVEGFWRWLDIIPVEQNGRDSQALRTAIRHLKDGGVLGIFAEGGLERPPGTIMPYEPGVGLLIQKTKARVLPVVIHGTPRCDSAFASLLRPSRARVRFLPVRDFSSTGLDAPGIAEDLERQAAHELGWPRGPRHVSPDEPGKK